MRGPEDADMVMGEFHPKMKKANWGKLGKGFDVNILQISVESESQENDGTRQEIPCEFAWVPEISFHHQRQNWRNSCPP